MEGLPRSQYDGSRFRNLRPEVRPPLGRLIEFLFGGNRPAPHAIPVRNIEDVYRDMGSSSPPGTALVTWIGHATFITRLENGITFITDPVFGDRCSPTSLVGPKRMVPPGLPLSCLNSADGRGPRVPVDFALVSHNHYDHLEASTVQALGDSVEWFVPLGLKSFFYECGVRRVRELDWGEQVCYRRDADDAVAVVTCLPCQHWSRRSLFDGNETLWASWSVQSLRTSVFFGGDSGYDAVTLDSIHKSMGAFDVALLPIGAYEPRDVLCFAHMNPEEAVLTHIKLGAALSIGMHWGTFILSREAVLQPPRDLAASLAQHGVPPDAFRTLDIGESISIKPRTVNAKS